MALDPSKDLKEIKDKILSDNQKMENYFESKYIKNRDGELKGGVDEKKYKDGSLYKGSLVDGKRSGKGIYHYSNGDKYIGDWKDDKFHGKGIYIFNRGDRYEGELSGGMKSGYGRYYYVNGNRYEGEWMNDKKHGEGMYNYHLSGESYKG